MPLNSPNSLFSLIWNIFSIISIISTLFIFPIDLVMGMNDMNYFYGDKWHIFNEIIIFIYSVDIIVNFNTSVYEKGIILKKKHDIVIKYISSGFIFDLLVLIPFICEII